MHDDKTTSITSVMTTGRQNDSVDSNTQNYEGEKQRLCSLLHEPRHPAGIITSLL